MIASLLREARPKQWAKNILVFAAPGAAGVLDDPSSLWRTVVAFVAFCMVSSGTYYWNDILDVESDRTHPTKRFRPIASGAVPLGVARVVGTVLLCGGIGVGVLARPTTALVLVVYVAVTTMYSSIFKHVAVVDLVAVASGFVLRAIAGAVAADVAMSTWFLLTTSFGSLFIVTAKRYAELRELTGAGPDEAGPHPAGPDQVGEIRATLEEYSFDFLKTVLSVSCGAALVSYCLWAFDTKEIAETSLPFYELSIVPMVTALLRYTLVVEQGHGAAPEEIFLADRTLQVLGVVWLVVFGLGVYV